jgi:hypothetical protein
MGASASGTVVKLFALVSIIGAIGGGATYAVHAHRASSRGPAPAASAAIAAVPPPVEEPSPVPVQMPATQIANPPPDPDPAPAPSVAKVPPHRSADPARPPPSSGTLAAEAALIARAQAALGAHDPSAALAAIDEHATRYPKGQFADEREALRIVAGCSIGRSDARAKADRFLRAHPTAPLASRIRKECGEKNGN